jgi:ABC-type branched-subunit amino acid transport system ATPase component
MTAESLAVVEELTERFGARATPALDRIDVVIGPGRVTGLVGPGGAGKATRNRVEGRSLQDELGSATMHPLAVMAVALMRSS